jgi:ankyrin repeat protein
MKFAAVLAAIALTGCISAPVPPLIGAARSGDTARIAQLIASGADVNVRGGVNNWTALMHAIHKNQLESVKALLDAGADVNAVAVRETALTMAAAYGYADIVRELLDYGAKPSADALDGAVGGANDIDRFTVGKCQAETVRALIEKDPSLGAGASTLRIARLKGCREVIALLEHE